MGTQPRRLYCWRVRAAIGNSSNCDGEIGGPMCSPDVEEEEEEEEDEGEYEEEECQESGGI